MLSKSKISGVVWYKSLGFSILFWFLLLSLVPLLIISYESNAISVKSFKEAAYEDLKHSVELEKKFIDNWFYYRKVDISIWSQTKANIDFLTLLISEYKNSNNNLSEFVKTYNYVDIRNKNQNDLLKLVKHYDYIYDLFLINDEGDILYTVAQEDDLGTNLLEGEYSSTKFAASYSKTIKDGKINFSDLELYKPSNNVITGFLTAPLVDDKGNRVGVMAVQLKAERISSLFNDGVNRTSNYLLSSDGLLISDMASLTDRSKVEALVLKEWYISHKNEESLETMSGYKNPFSQDVIGTYDNVDVLGVKWILFSEINEESIYKIANKATYKAFIFFIITMIIVVIVAFFISRRIVKPIKSLLDASIKFSRGERDVSLNLGCKGEIGELESAFNIMIYSLKENEERLKEQTSEAKKALQELAEQKFALDAHSIVAITDVKGTITFVNEKFIEISGYPREELIGKNHRLLNSGLHGMEFWNNMYATVSSGKIWHDEVCNIAKDGHFYWVDTTIVPFMNENNKPKSYVAIRTDITDKKAAELELIEANEIAEESVKAKSEFLATMSHEIRTPMNGVIGMLGLLMNTKLDETQRRQASLAEGSAKALLTLINDILDFSKLEAEKMELDNIDFNLRDELETFRDTIAIKAQEKGIEVILDTSDIKTDIINADLGRIRQILFNIVGNAVKFTSKGHVLIKASLTLVDKVNARLILKMSDTGIGIPNDKLDRLFESFSQVDASTTRKYGGTGLGLAIVQKLCSLMGGKIDVKSDLGHGSTFTVDIGVKLSKSSSLVKTPIADNIEFDKNTKVLLVEDNQTNQIVAQGILNSFGLNADVANNGIEALELLKDSAKKYDVVLMDCQMPELDGYDTTRAIRDAKAGKAYISIPIIAMTANAMAGDKEKCSIAGMDDYLSKPLDPELLRSTLAKWLLKKDKVENNSKKELLLWDEKNALNRLGGSEKLLKKVLLIFADDIQNSLKSLKEAIEKKDDSGIKLHSHSIKGSCGNVSAMKMEQMAREIELNESEFKEEELHEKFQELQKNASELLRVLDEYIKKDASLHNIEKKLSELEIIKIMLFLKEELKKGSYIDTGSMDIFNISIDEARDLKLKKLKKEIDSFLTDEALVTIDDILNQVM
ncbi:multi-sensor hybrid histidine kinase [Sulfurimonas gotlandica GD1]|uniref:Sensory/regulatory protein RpfC n=1 Tax=Sulfurimonas gotlandica (strain DSM 19862 / JCM 16533 / GD1) TaxID=929558 RepID=B6BIE4_SULGG|nr:ATP-binding protein [Sulfurimonas gotlandica]EDZ63257.1 multi-sensor hybrid histidine kinase [Sulfurimonas gotlandica GD1]EHP30297.1 multi-sensor hybrid histidine kinase [Sulfurimonas gotlandica GD1]